MIIAKQEELFPCLIWMCLVDEFMAANNSFTFSKISSWLIPLLTQIIELINSARCVHETRSSLLIDSTRGGRHCKIENDPPSDK